MLARVRSEIIEPALRLLPERMSSQRAVLILLATGLQESRFMYRRELGGPGRGLWHFCIEEVQAVMEHPASRDLTRALCAACSVDWRRDAVYVALEYNDVLAAAFARLLLWTDSESLPAVGDIDGAWAQYLRSWQPSHALRQSWTPMYCQACQLLMDEGETLPPRGLGCPVQSEIVAAAV